MSGSRLDPLDRILNQQHGRNPKHVCKHVLSTYRFDSNHQTQTPARSSFR